MSPTDFPNAWQHPPTRRSWTLHIFMNVSGLLGWIAAWWALLYVLVMLLSPRFTFLFVLPLAYFAYRAVTQLRYFRPAFAMRRVLRNYPWQMLRDVQSGLTSHPDIPVKHYGWFAISNPMQPEHQLPLIFRQHLRTEWWHRRMAPRAKRQLKAQINQIWFSGDPRFIGVIATATRDGARPRHLHVLEQCSAGDGQTLVGWGVTAEDVERARRVGVHVASLPEEARP